MKRRLSLRIGVLFCLAMVVLWTGSYTNAAPASSRAEQLKDLTKHLTLAAEALKGGDILKAKQQYREFDKGWDRIEDGVKAKSRDSYRKIEKAMSAVKVSLLKPEKPDSTKALAALNKVNETVDAVLPSLR